MTLDSFTHACTVAGSNYNYGSAYEEITAVIEDQIESTLEDKRRRY